MGTQVYAFDQIRPLIGDSEWGLTNAKTRQDVTEWAKTSLAKLPTYFKRIEKYNKDAIDGKVLLSLTMKGLTDRNLKDANDNKATLDKIKFLKREGTYKHKMVCMTKGEITAWAKTNLNEAQGKRIGAFNHFEVPVFGAARLLSLNDKLTKPKAAVIKAKNELKILGFKGKDEMLRQINLLKNGPKLPWLKSGRRLSAMTPSELVLHRRRLARGSRVSPVLAALMNEIEEAKHNHRQSRR